ncbi:MAG: hypothetical protein KY469_22295 [Actinobacteria bacterium]|nr:hypothetical protein [Actinomycetota bacterium]
MDIFRESLAGHGPGDRDDDDGPDQHDSDDGDGDDDDGGGDGGEGDGGEGDGGVAGCKVKPAQPLVLATTTLQDLIGLTHGPGELLTTLTGGRIRITNAALRRLVDEGGAALRLIVTEDTGRAVGVGRKTRVPPGWLREASLALHPECLEPNCRRSARQCDLDHAIPWDPAGSERPAPAVGSRSVLGAAPRKPTSSVVSVALRKPPSDEGFREGASQPSGRRARTATRRLTRPNDRPRSGKDPGI